MKKVMDEMGMRTLLREIMLNVFDLFHLRNSEVHLCSAVTLFYGFGG